MNTGPENFPCFDQATSGVVTVGTSAAQLPASNPGHVVLRGAGANTGTVTLGGSGVTSLGGFTLKAGEQVTLPLNNLSLLYAIASAASQKLEYIVLS